MTMFDPEKITFFAKTDARGQDISFGIKAKDRQRHMYVVGKTGMGKSTLLENMAAQDIQNGEGLAFIDPHGSAAETLLEYVPEHRVKDVVYFAPFDINNPVSFNVMEDVGADKRHLVVSGLMSTFKKIWVDAWSARMEYILTNALLVLIEYPDTTLLSVNRLFIDKHYRKMVVDHCQDPAVKSFWTEEFANYTDRFAAEALPAIQNKIGQFTGNPLIRNIIGQPHSSFDIREIMDNKKILIMNLSKGLIGETNANLLGSMLTTRIYLAAMSRADLPVEQMRQMPNFYFYVDEFQSFANATFANILSEARKYHLNLIIAHQYIAQMEEEVRDAVFGNVGTTVSFRVGPFDGEVLETVFAPRFEAADLVNLGFAQIYLTLMIDGIGSQPFSAVTLPPIEMPAVSCKDMVVASSRTVYAKERAAVEKIVDELHTPKKPEPSSKSPQAGGKPAGGQNNPNYKGNNPKGAAGKPQPNNQPATARPAAKPAASEPRKPAYPEKSADDLRAVLSKMTAGNQAQNKNEAAPAKAADAAPAVAKQVESPAKTTEKTPAPTPPSAPALVQKPTHTQRPAQPAASERDNNSHNNKNNNKDRRPDARQNDQRPRVKNNSVSQPNQPKQSANDLKSALANALKQAEQSRPTPPATTAAPQQTAPAAAPPPEQPAATKPAAPAAQIGAARRSGLDVSPAAAPSQPTPAPVTAPPAAAPPRPPADSLDPQVIKKMLRHNGQERTPFQ